MTPQEKIRATLAKSGIPAKEIKCFGSQVLIVAWGEEAAKQWLSLLAKFASKTRGPVRSIDYTKNPTRGTCLVPQTHTVWLVGATL